MDYRASMLKTEHMSWRFAVQLKGLTEVNSEPASPAGRDHLTTAPMQAVAFLVLKRALMALWCLPHSAVGLHVQLFVFRSKNKV